MPAWEDRDGDGHKELSGEVAPVAAGVATYYGVVAGGLTAAAGVSAATVVGLPAAAPLTAAAGVTAVFAAGASGVAYFADRYDWEYSIEPGSVIQEVQETAGEVWEEVRNTPVPNPRIPNPLAPLIPDPLEPFVPNPLEPLISGPWNWVQDQAGALKDGVLRSGAGQALGMSRLDEAFARLQSLL